MKIFEKEIHNTAARAAPGDLYFKVSSEGLLIEIDILIRLPIKVLTVAMLHNPIVPGS